MKTKTNQIMNLDFTTNNNENTRERNEKYLKSLYNMVSVCEKSLKQALFQRNEQNSSTTFMSYNNETFSGIDKFDENYSSISMAALKSEIDNKIWKEEEHVKALKENKELKRMRSEKEEKHKVEQKNLMDQIKKLEKEKQQLRDSNKKKDDENNYLKNTVIQNYQKKNIVTEKERDFYKNQLQHESNGSNISTKNMKRERDLWKEKYQNEKVKNMKLSIKLRKSSGKIANFNDDRSRIPTASTTSMLPSSGHYGEDDMYNFKSISIGNVSNNNRKSSEVQKNDNNSQHFSSLSSSNRNNSSRNNNKKGCSSSNISVYSSMNNNLNRDSTPATEKKKRRKMFAGKGKKKISKDGNGKIKKIINNTSRK